VVANALRHATVKVKGNLVMKPMKTIAVAVIAVAGLASIAVAAAEVRARTVQYGQGPPVTYFEPVTPKTTIGLYKQDRGLGSAQTTPAESTGHWRTVTPPNGGPVSVWVSH